MVNLSFEFFPPKTEESEKKLWSSIKHLSPLNPKFVSVTYGSGGSTRNRTHKCVEKIINETNLKPAAHLTCVSSSKMEVDQVIANYHEIGVRHIVALRGDMPDMGTFEPHPEGYSDSVELVKTLHNFGILEITVGTYPEKHPDSKSIDDDIEFLKRKIDAGANRAITQFVFDEEILFQFREKIEAAGINIPIIPGIMPTTNFKNVKNMAQKCGATIPNWLEKKYEGLDDDHKARREVAKEIGLDFCEKLISNDFMNLHFYTLNQADLTYDICSSLY